MPNAKQLFLAAATEQAAKDLVTAFLSLPEDKQDWSPAKTARTAIDLIAECALVSYTAELIETRKWREEAYEEFQQDKAKLAAGDWETLPTLLRENTKRVIAAITAVSEEDMALEIPMPWGTQPLGSIIAYPYWNMSYHQGQIYYIGSILEGGE